MQGTATVEGVWTQLHGRQPVSRTTIHGKASLIFGTPFLIAGVAIMLVAADVIPVDNASIHAPRWVIGVVGLMFASAGTSLVIHAWSGAEHVRRVAAAKDRYPDEPWMADHPWDRQAAVATGGKAVARGVFGVVFMTVFLAPFNWWAFASGEGAIMLTLIVSIFDLMIIGVLVDTVYKAVRKYKYGASRLRFSSFPFFLGETLDVSFSNPRGIGLYELLTITLRCIQERYEMRGRGEDRRQEVILYEMFKDEQIIEGPGEYRGGDADLRIRFALPDEEWETRLAERPPRYWSLQIKATTPGVDFNADFVVPVYREV